MMYQQHIDRINELDRQPRIYEPGDSTGELIDAMKTALIDLLQLAQCQDGPSHAIDCGLERKT